MSARCSVQATASQPASDRATATSPSYRETTFYDVDHLGEAIATSGLQLTQLSQGVFQCHGQAWTVGSGLMVNRYQLTQAVQAIGDKSPDRLIFAVLLQTLSSPTFSHGRPLVGNVIFGFDAQRPMHLITSSEGQDQCQIEVSKALFQHYAALAQRYDLDDAFLRRNLIAPALDRISPLCAYLRQLFQTGGDRAWAHSPQAATLLEQDLMPLLIDALPPPPQADVPRSCRRADLVATAKAYIMAHLDQPLTLAELCLAVHASQRSLHYGFQEMLGMGPMAFVKVQRLHGVRRALRSADPKPQTIACIAHQWGFFSLGHFSKDYKQLFGESPSQTLQRW